MEHVLVVWPVTVVNVGIVWIKSSLEGGTF